MTAEVDASRERSPDEIWARALTVEHTTYRAYARRTDIADNAEEDDQLAVGKIEITPLIYSQTPMVTTFGVRARCRFERTLVAFEEAARIQFEDETELSAAEISQFGADYILPLLLPYVEIGFTRMCAVVDQRAPQFPFIVVKGHLYSDEPPTDDEANENAGPTKS